MFIPFFSAPRPKSRSSAPSRLARRRGGGKTGGGSSSSSGGKTGGSSGSSSSGGKTGSTGGKTTGSSGSSSSSSSKGGSSTPIKSTPIKTTGGSSRTITSYGGGGGKISTIPAGQMFSGRSQGGATRTQVWGTSAYGSGYPGSYTRGVSGRGFPFYFWPLAWGSVFGYGANTAYLHSDEYGRPDNSSRPGGAMSSFAFTSNSTGTTFRLVADNDTTTDLMSDIAANCSAFFSPLSSPLPAPTPFNASAPPVQPEQVVQYFRASSVALSLDGYNNSAVFAAENSTANTPLPAGIDSGLLECLNVTIGLAVPLVDGGPRMAVPSAGIAALVLLILRALL
ncbi:hypothetical protein FB451DRAFT_1027922 [Mycena latifolia]|nr:hypothetical protein FB451DRAFT_1027922 [Mycena latifolia]